MRRNEAKALMVLNIEQDYLRFRQIVRGKIKQDLKKYISQGELIGKKGKDYVSIPIPQIEMPNFRFARRNTAGTYDPLNPYIVPIHEDKRYLSWKTKQRPESNALIIYMMDVSGSMGDEQKEIVRIESFWIDTWIKTNYNGVVTRYIIHDAVAQEVDDETFFHTRESGGTVISSAYELCNKIIEEEYPQELWNIYVFHFSDGDNWSGGDTDRCIDLLKTDLLPKVNLVGYGQVESTYGSGQFLRELENSVNEIDNLILSRIENKEDIYQSIKDFLGKGK